jgi:hypothetical protein
MDAQTTVVDSLVFDLVEWVAKEPRTYAQVMDAWRTSCPRLTVWEEALERQLLARKAERIVVTHAGRKLLRQRMADLCKNRVAARRSAALTD